MKERPILFSAPMVRAILEDRKTQTRRVVKPMAGEQSCWLTPDGISTVPHGEMIKGGWQMHHPRAGTRHMGVDVPHDSPLGWIRCPYGAPGDLLWVRETWHTDTLPLDVARAEHEDALSPSPIFYRADKRNDDEGYIWRPSIHMPRWASRITLKITDVRVERLQDISENDAVAEGCVTVCMTPTGEDNGSAIWGPDGYAALWSSINGANSWAANPWVWVVSFERVNK